MINIKTLFSTGSGSSDGTAPQGYAPHEEFESKRTTKLGMVMVVVMIVTGLWQGQNVLNAINSSITPPESLSYCFFTLVQEGGLSITVNRDKSAIRSPYSYQNAYTSGSDGSDCSYSEIEKKYGVPALYDTVSAMLSNRSRLYKERSDLESTLRNSTKSNGTLQNSYNTSLLETMSATGEVVYSQDQLAERLRSQQMEVNALQAKLDQKNTEIQELSDEIKTTIFNQRNSLDSAATDFNNRVRWLELKRFIVVAVLLFPLMFFGLRRYFRAKNERSEFAIIWGGVAVIFTLLSAQVFVIFAYKILPRGFVEALATFFATIFSQFKILFVLAQWGAFVLIPLFFGYIVYTIQKKYYNKQAVIMRALKDGKCPQCSMKIKDQMVHCPSCSYALRKACTSCQHSSISYARYCESCGTMFNESAPTNPS